MANKKTTSNTSQPDISKIIPLNAYIPGWMHSLSQNAGSTKNIYGNNIIDTNDKKYISILSALKQNNVISNSMTNTGQIRTQFNNFFLYLCLDEQNITPITWLDIALILIGQQNKEMSNLKKQFEYVHTYTGICNGKFLTYSEAARASKMNASFSGCGHSISVQHGLFWDNFKNIFKSKDYYYPITKQFFAENLLRSHIRWNASNVPNHGSKEKKDNNWYYYLRLNTAEEEIMYAAGGSNYPVDFERIGEIAFSCETTNITKKIEVKTTNTIFSVAVCAIAYKTYTEHPFVFGSAKTPSIDKLYINVDTMRIYMKKFTQHLVNYINSYNYTITNYSVKGISDKKNGTVSFLKNPTFLIFKVKDGDAPVQECGVYDNDKLNCRYTHTPTTKIDYTTGKVYSQNAGGNFIITKNKDNKYIVPKQDKLIKDAGYSSIEPSAVLTSGDMKYERYFKNFATDADGKQISKPYGNYIGSDNKIANNSNYSESSAPNGDSPDGDQPKEIKPDQGVMDILNNGIDKEDPNNISSGIPTGRHDWFKGVEDIYTYMHNDNTVFDGARFTDKDGRASTDRSKFVDIIQSLQPLSLWGVGGMPATFLATTDPPAWWLSDKQTGGERYGLGNIYLNHYIKYGSYVTFRPCLPRFDSAILSLGSEILSSPIDAVKNVIQKIITGNAMELEGQAYRYWGQVSRMCRVAIYLMGIQHETIRFVTGKALIGDIIKQASNRAGVHFDPYGEEFQFGAMRADAWSTIGMEFNSIISNTPRVSPNTQSKDGGKDSKSSDDTYGHYSKSRDYDKLHVSKYHGGNERWKKETVEQGAIIKNKAEKLGSVSSSGEITPGGDAGKAGDPIKLEGDLDYGTVSFMLDGPLEISESMQNTSGESAIATALASVSGDSSDGMKEVLQGMFGARANEGLIGLFTGNYMIPKVYSSSSASRNYSMSMVFSSFSGDPVAIFLNCIYPLIKLQALTFPEATGGLLYSPWIVNMYSSQGVNIEWGLITDLSVKKDPATYNDAGMPTTLNVTVGVEDLRPFAFMEKPTFWSYASKFSGSATMMLASLVGRNFTTISYEQKQAFRDVMARLNYAEEVGRLGTEWRISVSRWGARLGSWFHNVYDRANDKYNSFDSWLTDLSGQDAYSKALSKVDNIISTTNAIKNK